MDRTDARLRELLRRNAPPADEAHLAAALRPETVLSPRGATTRTPKRTPGRRVLRLALMIAGALVGAAAIGVAGWQAAAHLGGDQSVVVITDRPTSTGSTGTMVPADLRAQFADGTWEFRADRQADLGAVQLPSDELSEQDYRPIEDRPAFAVVVSDGGAKISIKGMLRETQLSAEGSRGSNTSARIQYDLDTFAGGRFVVWKAGDGLRAEFTQYGSGLPIILSYRGSLVRTTATQSFDGLWAASVAAVNALGSVRVSITQTADVTAVASDSPLSSAETGAFVTTVEELLDPGGGRARRTMHTPEEHIQTTTANGRDELFIDVDPLSSAPAPATATVRAEIPPRLPLPLWAGDGDQGYTDLLTPGSSSDKRVIDLADGGGSQLSWRQTWDQAIGTYDFNSPQGKVELTGAAKIVLPGGSAVQFTQGALECDVQIIAVSDTEVTGTYLVKDKWSEISGTFTAPIK
jgi:hypothetical protein